MRQIDVDARRAARGDRQAVRGDHHGLRGNPKHPSLNAEGTLLRRAAADPKRPHESSDGDRRRQRLAEFTPVHTLARSPRHSLSAGWRRHLVARTTRLLLWTTSDREALLPTGRSGARCGFRILAERMPAGTDRTRRVRRGELEESALNPKVSVLPQDQSTGRGARREPPPMARPR